MSNDTAGLNKSSLELADSGRGKLAGGGDLLTKGIDEVVVGRLELVETVGVA